jgi:hypothetical protein
MDVLPSLTPLLPRPLSTRFSRHTLIMIIIPTKNLYEKRFLSFSSQAAFTLLRNHLPVLAHIFLLRILRPGFLHILTIACFTKVGSGVFCLPRRSSSQPSQSSSYPATFSAFLQAIFQLRFDDSGPSTDLDWLNILLDDYSHNVSPLGCITPHHSDPR